MALPLPENVKQRAEKLCARLINFEVVNPGTWIEAEGKTFVTLKDKPTGIVLFVELPESCQSM